MNTLPPTQPLRPRLAAPAKWISVFAAASWALAGCGGGDGDSSPSADNTSGVASLPADLLTRPAARNCNALRSGTYRVIAPTKGKDIADQFGTATIDAAALTSRDAGSPTTDSLTPNGDCRYRDGVGPGDTVVSQAGIIVSRYQDPGQPFRLAFGFPEQTTISVADLEGTWNTLGFELNDAGTAYAADAATATIGRTGTVSNIVYCANVKTCVAVNPNPSITFKANPTGGFDFVNTTDGYTDRYFAYRAGGGEVMLVGVAGNGSFNVWSKKRTNTLPDVGTLGANWNLSLDNQNLATPAFSEVTSKVDSVNVAAGSFTRTQSTVGFQDTHSETLMINNPRDGYLFRGAATAPGPNGTTVNVREFTGLPLRGMGMTVLSLPSLNQYLFSVAKP